MENKTLCSSKKVIAELPVCYCVAPLLYHGEQHFVVASEQDHPCLLFDRHGNAAATIWEKPGGTMSAVQIPGRDGAFLAIRQFYSPDRGKDAGIWLVREENGVWKTRLVAALPCVHRFDILTRGHVNWVIACCLKEDYACDDDWRFPGKTCVCRLPDNLSEENAKPLEFTTIKMGMLKNHGYSRDIQDGVMSGIVSCEEGTYRFTPPEKGGPWTVETLCEDPASDAVLIDLDGCGEKELITICPFHGDTIAVYKLLTGTYRKIWEYEKKVPFAHAITSGVICGRPTVVLGHRQGSRDLFFLTYEDGYRTTVIDRNIGPANVLHLRVDGKDVIVSANREINEVAYYSFERR